MIYLKKIFTKVEIECAEAVKLSLPHVAKFPWGKLICAKDAVLGEGAFGKVFRVTPSTSPIQVALKIQVYPIEKAKGIESVKREIDVMKLAKNQYSLLYLHDFRSDKPTELRHFIFMEMATGGSLTDWIPKNPNPKPDKIFFFLYFLGEGLDYLEKQGIVHLDIKTDNIMLTKKNVKNPLTGKQELLEIPVFVDFGVSQCTGRKYDHLCGTLPYLDPEFYLVFQFAERKIPMSTLYSFNPGMDMYSMGIVLYQMCHNSSFPFPIQDYFLNQLKGKYKINAGIDGRIANLITNLLSPFDSVRITAKMLSNLSKLYMVSSAKPITSDIMAHPYSFSRQKELETIYNESNLQYLKSPSRPIKTSKCLEFFKIKPNLRILQKSEKEIKFEDYLLKDLSRSTASLLKGNEPTKSVLRESYFDKRPFKLSEDFKESKESKTKNKSYAGPLKNNLDLAQKAYKNDKSKPKLKSKKVPTQESKQNESLFGLKSKDLANRVLEKIILALSLTLIALVSYIFVSIFLDRKKKEIINHPGSKEVKSVSNTFGTESF